MEENRRQEGSAKIDAKLTNTSFRVGATLGKIVRVWSDKFLPLAALGFVQASGSLLLVLTDRHSNISVTSNIFVNFLNALAGLEFSVTSVTLSLGMLLSWPLHAIGLSASLILLERRKINAIDALRAAWPTLWRLMVALLLIDAVFIVIMSPMHASVGSKWFPREIILWAKDGGGYAITLLLGLVSIVVGPAMLCRWVAVFPVVVFEGLDGVNAISRSTQLAGNHMTSIFTVGLVYLVVTSLLSKSTGLLRSLTGSDLAGSMTFVAIESMVTLPLLAVLFYVIYEHLVDNHLPEGGFKERSV